VKAISALLAAAAATAALAIPPAAPAFAASNQCPTTKITVHTTTNGHIVKGGGVLLVVVSPTNPPIGNWCKVTVDGRSGHYWTYNHNNITATVTYQLSSTFSPPPKKPTPVTFPKGNVTFITVATK
jgi:hypothetical protein